MKTNTGDWSDTVRLLFITSAVVIVVLGMKMASTILAPFLLAVFIAIVLSPLYFALQRWRIPAWLALLVIFLGLGFVTLSGIGLAHQSLSTLAGNFPEYQQILHGRLSQLSEWVQSHGVDMPGSSPAEIVDARDALVMMREALGAATGLLAGTFIILLVVAFILLEAGALPDKVRSLPGLRESAWERVQNILNNVRQYMGMKTLMSLLTGFLVAVWLVVLGVDYPVLLGMLAFLLNYIPTIGSFVAAVPGVFFALLQYDVATAVIAAVGYFVINVGVSNGLEPRVMGRGLGLSPLVVLMSMIFWGWVLGPIGMLLSVPLTMAIKIALESDDDARWIAIMLGPPNVGEARKSERSE